MKLLPALENVLAAVNVWVPLSFAKLASLLSAELDICTPLIWYWPLTLILVKLGLEVVAMLCGKLNVRVLPDGVIITWLAVPARVTAPLSVFSVVTALVMQVGQVKLPAASSASGPDALTATVPVALGIVIVWLAIAGVAKIKLLVKLPFLAESEVEASPCSVNVWVGVPTVRVAVGVIVLTPNVPPTVTVPPLWLTSESPIVKPLPVNTASLPVVPPPPIAPVPPVPTQLPAAVQTSLPLTLAPAAPTSKYLVVPALSVTVNKSAPSGLAASCTDKAVVLK